MKGPVLIAAGGTGGHLFPAQALAAVLLERGVEVHLVTDTRVGGFTGAFPAREVHEIPAATPRRPGLLPKALAGLALARGFLAALRLVRRLRPSAVVGFGGYPTVPPVLAASLLRVPTIVHEGNGVVGKANSFLGPRVTALALGIPGAAGVDPRWRAQVVAVGNPVRPAVRDAADAPFPPLAAASPLNILVFGGSQGARVMADVAPEAIAGLPEPLRRRLLVSQQARPEDQARVEAAYRDSFVTADVQSFFADLPARMARAHLVVARSGASTVAELTVIGRPSILVPLPHALDADQAVNARALAAAGAATVIPQAEFTPARLRTEIEAAVADPDALAARAAAARALGLPDAAERLADLVAELARPA